MRRLSAREILSVSNILTVILVSIILSQSINYFYVVYDLNLSKLLSVIFILLFTTVVLACKDTIRYVPEFFLMALPAVPVFFVHGYVNSGLLLIVLLGIAIANSHIKERAIYITYNLLFWTSVLIIVYGITITSDISFMRDEIYILPNQEITLFGNINKFTYLLVAMLSVFGYMFLANKITLISFISRFAVIFLIVAVVTQTRVSTVAVLFQVLIFLYAKNRKMSIGVKNIAYTMIFTVAISSAYFLNPRIEDTGRILVDTMQGISSGDVSGKNARPQVWAATYLTLSENPWFGVGSKIHESFYKYGAVKERDGYVNVRAPQGSIPGVMLRSGVIFGILYTLSFLILLYRFVVMINTYRPVAYGGISLLVGGGIVQFGGDFFIQIMFIVTLGYFLSIGSSRHTTIQDSYSGYHEK